MTNQIQPSYAQEEQPERFYCRHCQTPLYFSVERNAFYSIFGSSCYWMHVHEIDRRLPRNAQKRQEVEEYLEEIRNER